MASIIYNSFLEDVNEGNVVPAVDTFYIMLVTSAYVPNKDAHTRRSDVTDEVAGAGYVAGGQAITVTVTPDLVNDRTNLVFTTPLTWAASTITGARAGVIYKRRGGIAANDELVSYSDFGADYSSAGVDFTIDTVNPIRYQN